MKIFKTIILSIIMLLSFNSSFSQTNGYDTTQYYGKMNWIYYNVNTSLVTTGLLRDYGIDFLNLDNYTGTALNDSNFVGLDEWRLLYASLYSDHINANGNFLALDTLNRLFTSKSQTASPINFVTLFYNYQSFVPNAVTSNLIRVTNGQLFDVAGRPQSPYTNNYLFASAPLQQAAFIGANQILFSSSLFFGNTGKTISSIQVDPKGTGTYQTASLNVPFNVTYDTSGFYTVNVKITYTDATIELSHTKLTIYSSANGALAFNKNNFASTFKGTGPPYLEEPFIFGTNPSVSHPIPATKAYMGVLGQGDYTVDLSVNNNTGKIKKPLIIVDGFDPDGSFTYSGEYLTRIGYDINYGYPNYFSFPIPLNGINGLDNSNSYDLIYLHWKNGTDYIQRNAYLLEALIQYVNTQKALNGSAEQNVILGFSMGGLITRYALRDMEINNIPHQTRLFISHDAPYWGANVPVAAQAAVQQLAPWKIINVQGSGSFPFFQIRYTDLIPAAVDGLNLLTSPAAQQMIIQNYILSPLTGQTLTANNSVHTAFLNELNTMGWPLNCRIVTLANGACNGNKIYADNSNIAQISGNRPVSYLGSLWRSLALSISGILAPTTVLTGGPGHPIPNGNALIWQFPLSLFSTKNTIGINFSLNSVPASGTSRIYTGDVYSTKKILGLINVTNYFISSHVNSTSDMLPLDNAPGGEYSLIQFGFDPSVIQTSLPAFFQGYIHTVITQPNFCFVPTVSSLAISNPQSNLSTNICSNVNCLKPTQVSDYYAPPVNQLHVSYTTDNSNWILQEQDAGYTCSSICPTGIKILGPAQFCVSGSYSVNSPAGNTITWSASPSNAVSFSSTSTNPTTVTKTGSGTVTLIATINNACNIAPVTKTITIGAPPPSSNSISGATIVYASAGYHYLLNTPNNSLPNNILWIVPTGWTILDGQGTKYLHVTTGSQGGQVQCDFDNVCGEPTGIFITAVIGNGGPAPESTTPETSKLNTGLQLTATPNPASNKVLVSLISGTSTAKTSDGQLNIRQIKITDKTGMVKKQFSFNTASSSQAINVQDMLPDVYFIQVFTGKEWLSCKLVIVK
jgi:hypothetical protein